MGMLDSLQVSLLMESVYQWKWGFVLHAEVVVRIFLHRALVVMVHYHKDSCCPQVVLQQGLLWLLKVLT